MSKLNTWEYSDGWTRSVDNKFTFNQQHVGWHAYVEFDSNNTTFEEWVSKNLLNLSTYYVPTVTNDKAYIKLHLQDKNDANRLAEFFGLDFN